MTIAPGDFKPLVDSKLIRFGGHWADAHIKSAKGSTLFVSYNESPALGYKRSSYCRMQAAERSSILLRVR